MCECDVLSETKEWTKPFALLSVPLHQSSIIIRKKKGGGWRQYRSNIETFIWSRSVVAHACMRDAARFAVAASNSMHEAGVGVVVDGSVDEHDSVMRGSSRGRACGHVQSSHVHACLQRLSACMHFYRACICWTTIRALCIGHACDASKSRPRSTTMHSHTSTALTAKLINYSRET